MTFLELYACDHQCYGDVSPDYCTVRGYPIAQSLERRVAMKELQGKGTTSSRTSDISNKAAKAKKGKGKGKGKRSKTGPPDDDEEALFGQSPRRGDDEDDMFAERGGGMFSSSNGLFDDDDDDNEGGLFAETEKPKQKAKARAGSMFDDDADEENEDDNLSVERKPSDSRPRTRSGKQLPKGAVSVFGDGGDILASAKLESSGTHVVKKPTAQTSEKKAGGGGGGGLFDDDEEDDLFGGAPVKVEAASKAKPATKTQPAKKKVNLFADEEDEEDDLFGSMAAPTSRTKTHSNVGLTVEGYDEEKEVEDRKHQDEERMRKASVEKKLPAGAVSLFGKGPNPMVAALKKRQGLPSDSEEEDKQEWSDNEDRLSGGSSNQSGSVPSLTSKPATGSGGGGGSGGIFADDEDNEDSSLFSASIGGGRYVLGRKISGMVTAQSSTHSYLAVDGDRAAELNGRRLTFSVMSF
ncbi:hypothetical protein RRG08_028050 [Elysia crispata]|uniref:Uncharacterized protein n=1 Tax=Elysia crispata TaxID=231223 RepID=A0AAE1A745_9GAST|nr:hypothetical protein RRG08_028050 [Elysia crispata]